jgi:hypothetical protein
MSYQKRLYGLLLGCISSENIVKEEWKICQIRKRRKINALYPKRRQ